jgi:hypothetical protein
MPNPQLFDLILHCRTNSNQSPNKIFCKYYSELECEREEKKPEFVLPLSLSHSLWFFVPEAGIEPARLAAQDFESSASTSSATRAHA